jgi:hypothetical protein
MRETAAQKKTRITTLLAAYDAARSDALKQGKEAERLKKEIEETVPVGTYGDWQRGEGAPREILDQAEAKKLLTGRGIPIPVKVTAPSVTVTHV